MSFVFAYDGLSGSADLATPSVALRLEGQPPVATQDRAGGRQAVAVVVAARTAAKAA
ncbi:MAG: hypothetical protein H0W96_07105, partial [Solirubrobacterales bacterium]|nr:hypothetical protein [Solirubrobacterales bacterium]